MRKLVLLALVILGVAGAALPMACGDDDKKADGGPAVDGGGHDAMPTAPR